MGGAGSSPVRELGDSHGGFAAGPSVWFGIVPFGPAGALDQAGCAWADAIAAERGFEVALTHFGGWVGLEVWF